MPTVQQQVAHKFKLDRVVDGDLTILTLHGVIDEAFEGKKLAQSIKTKKVVLQLRDVRRFASWGMSEWMDFVRGNATRDLYVVECSTHALNQFTLVTGLLGHTKLISFYLPYRCSSCGDESNSVFLVPLDRAALRDVENFEGACVLCGGPLRVDKVLGAMCTAIAEWPAYDIDDGVVGYLRGELKYNVSPDVNRFRAQRLTSKSYTYFRLSGNVAGLVVDPLVAASANTTVLDLAGITTQTFEPATLTAWRTYLDSVLPKVESLQIVDCPSGFLENALQPADFHKLKVRTFATIYNCMSCNTAASYLVDVAANLEFLVEGSLPAASCSTCKGKLQPTVTPDLVAILSRLPARPPDAALDKFLAKARRERIKNLDDALVVLPPKLVKQPTGRGTYFAIVLSLIVLGGLAVVAVGVWRKNEQPVQRPNDPELRNPPPPTFQRPDWIVTDQPGSAFCQEASGRLVCVGVSLHRPTRNEAIADANDAALEELANTIGLRIATPFFKDNVLSTYSESRSKALAALQAPDLDRTSTEFAAAGKLVRDARARVVQSLRASGGAAVPPQRTDWYWEEYALDKGIGTELLVFIRYDLNLDAVKSLVDTYSGITSVLGSDVMTAFPALAWRQPKFTGGALVTNATGVLAEAGLGAKQIVTGAGGQPIFDAAMLAKRVDDATGPLKLTVLTPDGTEKSVEVKAR